MNLLVTGGCGFIGANFILYWLGKYPKDKIVNVDLCTYAAVPESLKSLDGDERYTFVKADIADLEKIIKS